MPNDASTVLAAVGDGAVATIAADARSVDRERAFPAAGVRALGEAGADLIEAVRWRGS